MALTEFKSEIVTINKSNKEIYKFLSNFKNFQKIIPEQISEWRTTEKTCSFKIENISSFYLEIGPSTPYNKIVYQGKASQSGMNIDFNFEFYLEPDLEGKTTQIQLIILSDLNTFMKMILQSPMTNFVNLLVRKLKEFVESDKFDFLVSK